MFDSLFNYVVILIPIAIFIFRIVSNFRKQDDASASQTSDAGFEDDDEEEDDDNKRMPFPQGREPSLAGQAEKARVVPAPAPVLAQAVPASPQELQEEPSLLKAKSAAAFHGKTGRTGGLQSLDSLPPLKRGVVLAEILGPPKGM
jgi:hypothetical protein